MNQDIGDLIFQAIDEKISADDFERLQDAIENDQEVCVEYLRVVNLSESLEEIAHNRAIDDAPTLPKMTQPKRLLNSASDSASRTRPFSSITWLSVVAATLLIGVTLGWYWLPLMQTTAENKSVTEIVPAVKNAPTTDDAVDSEPLYVAQITSVTTDVVWGKGTAAADFLLRVRRGDRLEIETGLVHVEYFSGAKLIINGPSTFVTTGIHSGRLERGQVTGKVEGGDFLLTTPSARVLDLGTEFGVAVNDANGTDVCVFDGEVEVLSDLAGSESRRPVSLTEGMSARVDHEGDINQALAVDTKQFTREFPGTLSRDASQISLVDLLSATSENHFRLAGVIAADTGAPDQNPWLKNDGPGNSLSRDYQRTFWHPYVDGVFIPTESGTNTQLDSLNHQVNLPNSSGQTWGPIWSRRKINGPSAMVVLDDYWGTETLEHVIKRLDHCNTGMIGIHSNAGVTFDLDAVRRHAGSPTEFSGILSNLDNSELRRATPDPNWLKKKHFSADFRVFVDGELRASRLDFSRADGEMTISVKLTDEDRFLTFVSTDFDTFNGFDHVVVIDPVLNLK
ncbi:FecR protein [Planctomycetes bacterium CA13]|uniref:FecR protein n=1 Tax=Novipirellula herctigrandis TaxID=2527986 RepID=A0A5C5Z0U7_9BACT|nr:FecR protein [Planctomycetes bacterium CA13]